MVVAVQGQRRRHPGPHAAPGLRHVHAGRSVAGDGRKAAWASACRWSSGWSRCTAAPSRPGATATAWAASSSSACRWSCPLVRTRDTSEEASDAVAAQLPPPHPGRGRQPRRGREPGDDAQASWATRRRPPTTAWRRSTWRRRSGPTWSCSTSACRGLNGYDAASAHPCSSPGAANMVLVALTGWGQDDDKRQVAGSRVRPPHGQAGRSRGPRNPAGRAASHHDLSVGPCAAVTSLSDAGLRPPADQVVDVLERRHTRIGDVGLAPPGHAPDSRRTVPGWNPRFGHLIAGSGRHQHRCGNP